MVHAFLKQVLVWEVEVLSNEFCSVSDSDILNFCTSFLPGIGA